VNEIEAVLDNLRGGFFITKRDFKKMTDDEIREALNSPFAVLYIDGEDSILPCYPASIECDQDELDSFSEEIYNDAVAIGLGIGCLVWAEFVRVPPQTWDEGRIEFRGYWEYKSINVELTNILFKEKNDGRDC
jgi:hypothetical protein